MVPTLLVFVLLLWGAVASGSRAASNETEPALRRGKFAITEADRGWWSFQPLAEMAPAGGDGQRNRIDELLVRELSQHHLTMNPPAAPRDLVRRAFFDLTGLPPSPEEVAAFEADPSDAAWRRLIDRLLASPQYGEQQGRHWLDLVRYAESNGYERDGAKPNAWRFRDYVIRAFNEDKPYDQFIREQLAGDELAEEWMQDPAGPRDRWEQAVIATGFYRLHVWDDEPDSTVAAEFDDFDDVLVTTSTAFLGLTLGCARCHDHKFDPFSQADYYSLLSFFRGIDPYGQHKTGGGGRGTGRIERPLATPGEWRAWEREKSEKVRALEEEIKAAPDGEKKKKASELEGWRGNRGPFPYALAAVENGPKARVTQILARGDPATPRGEVGPAFPAILSRESPMIPERPASAPSSGRRRVLADWIANPANPLTSRVLANRLWQSHFGNGLAPTPDDFGRTGLPPRNQPLLDYLAGELIARGWSVKELHRLIMTSRAYRMTSSAANERGRAEDEGNTLFWRQNLRRLEAEGVRDSLLAISGGLNLKAGGPSVYPRLPEEVHRTQDSAGKGWEDSSPEDQNRRSVYLVVKRALKIPLLECFDFANSSSPQGRRNVTTTAPQALMLLNDGFVQAQAERLYERLRAGGGTDRAAFVGRAFALAVQRPPTAQEVAAAEKLMAAQGRLKADASAAEAERLGLVSFCHALLNLNEVIYVD